MRFSYVEVQEYNLTIGDADCDAYPLTLDWSHTKPIRISVDDYKTRPCKSLSSQSRRQRIAKVSGHTTRYLVKLETSRLASEAKLELMEWSKTFDERAKQSIQSRTKVAAVAAPTGSKGIMDLTHHLGQSLRLFEYQHGEDEDTDSLPASDDEFC